MNSTSKTTQSIALAAGLATAAAISLYFILKKSSKKVSQIQTPSSKKPLTEQEKADIIRQIKITYNGNVISVDSVIAIAVACEKISSAEYDSLFTKHEERRRGYKDNLTLYVKECESFINNCVEVETRENKKVFDSLGISQYTFEQTLDYYISQGEKRIFDLQNTLSGAEAKELNLEVLPMDKFRTILIRMTELFEAERVNVPSIKRLLNDPQYAGEVIRSRARDIIYKEFGVTQKDFDRAFSVRSELLASQNPELMERYSKAMETVFL